MQYPKCASAKAAVAQHQLANRVPAARIVGRLQADNIGILRHSLTGKGQPEGKQRGNQVTHRTSHPHGLHLPGKLGGFLARSARAR